jgi:hypothetical protein
MLKSLKTEVREKGYHIFSIDRNKTHNYYPGASNNYPGVSLNALSINDMITIKVFFIDDSDNSDRLEDIYLDLIVREIGSNNVEAMILTSLPDYFALKRGEAIEVREEEILYNIMNKDVTRRNLDSSSIH